MEPIILASSSPRRQEILKSLKIPFRVIFPNTDDHVSSSLKNDELPEYLAKEIMDGKIRLDGCINTYIMYLADTEDNQVRSLNTNLDFTQVIDIENVKDGMESQVKIDIKNFTVKFKEKR